MKPAGYISLKQEGAYDAKCHAVNMENRTSKIALFIDGANLHGTARALGFDVDFSRLLKEFQNRGTVLRAYYYTVLIEDQEYSSIRPLVDWLDYNGFTVVTKPAKEYVDAAGLRKTKRSMGIELAVDAMEIAPCVDEIVLFSGDGDFRSLVEAVQRRGTRVTVVSTLVSQPAIIADELRRQADDYIDLSELQGKLSRTPSALRIRVPGPSAPQFQAGGDAGEPNRHGNDAPLNDYTVVTRAKRRADADSRDRPDK